MTEEDRLPFQVDSQALYHFDIVEEALNAYLADRNKMIPPGKLAPFLFSRRFQSFVHQKLRTADIYKISQTYSPDYYFLVKTIVLTALKELYPDPEMFHNFIVENKAPTDRDVLFLYFNQPEDFPWVVDVNYVLLRPEDLPKYGDSKLVDTEVERGLYYPVVTRSMFLYERKESDGRLGRGSFSKERKTESVPERILRETYETPRPGSFARDMERYVL